MTKKEYLTSYKSYLKFKKVIDIIREGPCTRRDIAGSLDYKSSEIWHVMRVLASHDVIKIVEYDISDGIKRAVYKLLKDE